MRLADDASPGRTRLDARGRGRQLKEPSRAEIGAVRLASPEDRPAPVCTDIHSKSDRKGRSVRRRKAADVVDLCADLHRIAVAGVDLHHGQGKIRAAGFEPSGKTLRSKHGQPIDVTTTPVAELRQSENREVPPVVPSPPNSGSDPHLPADLLEIIAAWNTLPEAVCAGVLAMVRATKLQGHAGS
jgi:hypothetical protein